MYCKLKTVVLFLQIIEKAKQNKQTNKQTKNNHKNSNTNNNQTKKRCETVFSCTEETHFFGERKFLMVGLPTLDELFRHHLKCINSLINKMDNIYGHFGVFLPSL